MTLLHFHVYCMYSRIKKITLMLCFVNTQSFRNKITTIINKELKLTCNTGRGPAGAKGFFFNKGSRHINISFASNN